LHGSQFTSSFKNEYEAEARRIAKEFKPLTLKEKRKYYILVLFRGLQWVVKYTLIFLFLEPFVSKIIDKLHNFPRIIRYNFNELKWEIAWKKTR
jgi:hypothetical protein